MYSVAFRFRVVDGDPNGGSFNVELVGLETGYQATRNLAVDIHDTAVRCAMRDAWEALPSQYHWDPHYWPRVVFWIGDDGTVGNVQVMVA